MSSTANRPRQMVPPGEMFTIEEVARLLKTTPKAILRKLDKREFPEGGVFKDVRGRRIHGWALNTYIAEHSE